MLLSYCVNSPLVPSTVRTTLLCCHTVCTAMMCRHAVRIALCMVTFFCVSHVVPFYIYCAYNPDVP